MLWLDLIDILFLLVGVLVGYIVCCLIHRDILQDECESCEYREFIEEMIERYETE